jgi:hypothetical protein
MSGEGLSGNRRHQRSLNLRPLRRRRMKRIKESLRKK